MGAYATSQQSTGPGGGSSFRIRPWGPTADLTWLLFNFGGREAGIAEARQALYAADWQHNAAIQNVIWNQEESRFKTPPNIFGIGQGMLGPTIMVHGTDEQKKRYLRPMLRGEEIWCQLFSEPGAGSDVAGLATRTS